MRILVLGGGFGGIEVVNRLERGLLKRPDVEIVLVSDKLVGFRKQIQVVLDWWLAGFFPRDSAIMRQPRRCAICAEVRAPRESHAA